MQAGEQDDPRPAEGASARPTGFQWPFAFQSQGLGTQNGDLPEGGLELGVVPNPCSSTQPWLKARYSFPVNALLNFKGAGSIRISHNRLYSRWALEGEKSSARFMRRYPSRSPRKGSFGAKGGYR